MNLEVITTKIKVNDKTFANSACFLVFYNILEDSLVKLQNWGKNIRRRDGSFN